MFELSEEKKAFIALNLVNGLGSVSLKALFACFRHPVDILAASATELETKAGIRREVAARIVSVSGAAEFQEELRRIKNSQAEVITIFDAAYPARLKEIFDPPILFYALGDLSVLDYPGAAVVGCRRASFYGLQQAERISAALAAKGVCVVSGMARGIDSAAHKAALSCGGKTIAVLGSGLDIIYPPENRGLFERIRGQGLLISEFSLETNPHPGNFPRRNRIISGLSQAVVVVEAAKKSGSLITANLALEQGREVFAVPGAVNSVNAQGTNTLIKDGAVLVESAQDIIDAMNWDKLYNKCAAAAEHARPDALTDKILDMIGSEPVHIDILVRGSGLALSGVYKNLLELQLKGVVREVEGKRFVRI